MFTWKYENKDDEVDNTYLLSLFLCKHHNLVLSPFV
jgi:hypothetical protein